jgi:hypothetical protein
VLFQPQGVVASSRIVYTAAAPLGTRYTVGIASGATARSYERHPVTNVSWIGALKFCNWVTLNRGYAPAERCYSEGPALLDWHPVTISTAAWAVRDLADGERARLVAQYRGFRLPMDGLGPRTGFVGNPVGYFNEWYKAAAFDPSAPGFARIGPGGETVPPLPLDLRRWPGHFGAPDGNFFASTDPYDDDDAFVGLFDGSSYNMAGAERVGSGAFFASATSTNRYGLYDMSGNVLEHGQDRVLGQDHALHSGSWRDAAALGAGTLGPPSRPGRAGRAGARQRRWSSASSSRASASGPSWPVATPVRSLWESRIAASICLHDQGVLPMPRCPLVPTWLLRAALALPLVAAPLAAQLRAPGEPAALRHRLSADVPLLVLSAPDAGRLRAEAERDPWPFRYGVEIPLAASLEDSGAWERVAATGELVWRLELLSPGAFSLGVEFARFDVPRGALVFLYDPALREVLGAYGEHDENPDGRLAIQPLRGDRLVIEYCEPPGTLARPQLALEAVVHDYRDILAHLADPGFQPLSCLIDVNCPEGAEHQDVKRAVVWLLGGAGGCSGSILNNTAEDGTPYLYTGLHCGDMSNAVIVFDYERSGCGSGGASQSKTLSGATLLASSNGALDGQLYRLNQTPPQSYEPFHAGWSLHTEVAGPVFGISHPAGLPKKIHFDLEDPLRTSSSWSLLYDLGMIQPGSSGSPLFDGDERVIGSLYTGSGGCGSNFANYGRFDRFYASKDLEAWLDPLGWNPPGIDGFDPFEPYATRYDNDASGDGPNPSLYTAVNLPRLGTIWLAEIDTSAHPAATATLIKGYTRPADGATFGFGQLLIDTASPAQFQHLAPAAGGLSQHALALPASSALAGLASYTQAFLLGGPLTATNGLKLVLNF